MLRLQAQLMQCSYGAGPPPLHGDIGSNHSVVGILRTVLTSLTSSCSSPPTGDNEVSPDVTQYPLGIGLSR